MTERFSSSDLPSSSVSMCDAVCRAQSPWLSLVTFSVGAWFTYQAVMIIRALQLAEKNGSKSGQSIASKLSKNASRMGVAMMLAIILGVISEIVRQILLEEGGMFYWWCLLPLWAATLLMIMLTSFFQISAFQIPSSSRRVSQVSVFVDHMGKRLTITGTTSPQKDGVMRCSGLSSCSDAPSTEARLGN